MFCVHGFSSVASLRAKVDFCVFSAPTADFEYITISGGRGPTSIGQDAEIDLGITSKAFW